MRSCWRCGVDFDGPRFVPNAPCEDCQPEVPGHWDLGWSRGATTPEELERREGEIRRLHKRVMSDGQIGEYLGISERTVLRWRTKLGLKAHDFSGTVMWSNDAIDRITAASRLFWSDPENKKAWKAVRHPLRDDERWTKWRTRAKLSITEYEERAIAVLRMTDYGWTAQRIADRIGVSKRTVERWRNRAEIDASGIKRRYK